VYDIKKAIYYRVMGSSSSEKPVEAVPLLDPETAGARWRWWATERPPPAWAMFSTLLGGIVTDPTWMVAPMDDHLVHRGDGVFETLRCVAGALYGWEAHLNRLEHSAEAVALRLPLSRRELTEVVIATVRAAGQREAAVRVLVSRGPGGFGISPLECPAPQVYVIVYPCGKPFMELHPEGARVRTSAVPMKPGLLATAKTCNYLPNALMKLEAASAGVDFTVTFDEHGHLGEGATENFAIVDRNGDLRVPSSERILAGVTMTRVAALAARDPARCGLRTVREGPITRADVVAARELLIFSTTIEVASAVELDGRPIGDGQPGPVAAALRNRLREDMLKGREWRRPVWE